MSTIAAIATPLAVGGISVIRISGEKAFEIAEKVFSPISNKSVKDMSGYTCAFGKIFDGEDEVDEGILTVFRAPKSFTGENVCEISCHGGIYVTKKVLQLIINSGCELASSGEFTKRAFLNGKLSLTQAEAIIDTINAESEQALRAASSVREGKLFQRISDVKEDILSILAELSVWVDYPDEDISDLTQEEFISRLGEVLSKLELLSSEYETGKILREGINTVIVGKPNVGKSTLMNMLLGFDRSIVTDIAGTTRDVVEERLRLGDLILNISDTAGIRETSDQVEGIGVDLAKKKMEQADLVLAVFDNSTPLSDNDFELMKIISNKHRIAIINKSDLENVLDKKIVEDNFEKVIEISAMNGIGKDVLTANLNEIFISSNFNLNEGIISNERQRDCLTKALNDTKVAFEALNFGETFDAVTVLLDRACQYLLELTGEKITDAVVDNIFAKFCVGK